MSTIPADLDVAIRRSNLMFLWGREGRPFALRKDTKVTTHGAALKGEFISCLAGYQTLPAGTEGWLFTEIATHPSKTVWVGDEAVPADGAEIIQTGTYYTWCTLVEICGRKVLAEAFKFVECEPRVIGVYRK